MYVCMAFITERFLEVAVESWPEWDLNSITKGNIYFDL